MKSKAYLLTTYISAIAALLLTGCGPRESEETAKKERPNFSELLDPNLATITEKALDSGKQAYVQACYTCHGGDGMGMPGMQPALVGSEKLAGDPYYVIEWVLRGSGMLEGKKSEWPVMMPGHKHMTDEKIAAIISYVRKDFADGATPVTPKMVKLVRDVL